MKSKAGERIHETCRHRAAALCAAAALLLSAVLFSFPRTAFAAEEEKGKVRVGYYENEVFQEGTREDAVKTGYAYEYYQKISEYTGWQYEYVYGEYGELYKKLLDGEIDFLAGHAGQEEGQDKSIGDTEGTGRTAEAEDSPSAGGRAGWWEDDQGVPDEENRLLVQTAEPV